MLDNIGGGSNIAPIRVVEAVIDPRWRLFCAEFGGKLLPVLRIEHPRHGHIDCVLTVESLEGIGHSSARVIADLGIMPPEAPE